jgi:hypothetical protein
MASTRSHPAFVGKPGMFNSISLFPALISTCSGSPDTEDLLTFKFDTSASDRDDVHMGVVQKLVDAVVHRDRQTILECVPSLLSPPVCKSKQSYTVLTL